MAVFGSPSASGQKPCERGAGKFILLPEVSERPSRHVLYPKIPLKILVPAQQKLSEARPTIGRPDRGCQMGLPPCNGGGFFGKIP